MKLAVILGSARQGVGVSVAKWVSEAVNADGRFELDFVDVAELNLPFFNEDFGPKYKHYYGKDYTNPDGKAWAERVGAADAFLFVTPEYNHSTSAALKNALDWVGTEWNGKPVGLVGYSITPFGGVRAVEHLRQIAPELGLIQVRNTVLVGLANEAIQKDGSVKDEALTGALKTLLDEVAELGQKLA